MTLKKLLIREKAGSSDSRGIYIISSNMLNPEMYELKVQSPKDKNVWIQSIRAAVVDCRRLDDSKSDDNNMSADLKQRHIDEKQATIRELIGESLIDLNSYLAVRNPCKADQVLSLYHHYPCREAKACPQPPLSPSPTSSSSSNKIEPVNHLHT